ncbi:putative membrane protein [Anaerobranca californiensis DSM 14826]|jgi:putative membrane protein|uniref:Putative membrane protein n=1 Tax=Anaerobranca californiensis DSM 14826 TaxID=1120989 RepID=A0A1M6LH90_9FIRM|nr:DUF368 domain-containing protein [Anaerobranca californiensis]SHJ70475.1 putative membrane protein [Anaerobranca californiensis DSM 14826]
MKLFIQGLILGLLIVLPGMSGGTVLLIFGIYESLVKDLVKLKIKPYIPLILGLSLGIYLGSYTFALFFKNYRDFTALFLLGCLLASIKAVLKDTPKLNKNLFIFFITGIVIGVTTAGEPLGQVIPGEGTSWWLLVVGGALSTAAMIIPGVPGSSILIMLGIYDNLLFYIKELNIINLLLYGIGSLIGVVLLLKILERLFERYKPQLSYFFAGLIIGSTRILLPSSLNLIGFSLFLIGFLSVWFWSNKEEKQP